MNIEIRKVQFVNKGAELMLYAILEKLKTAFPNAKYVMAPNPFSPFEKRSALQLWQKAWYWRYRTQWGNIASLFPKKIRDMYGIVLDSEINIVIDAAGFSYSDQLPKNRCIELAESCKRWKNNGTKIILLPQALGPFDSKQNKKNINIVADCADLIFAREKTSYNYLVKAVGKRSNLKIAPDFTNLIQGDIPDYFYRKGDDLCIIPNYRMIDKTTDEKSKAYLPFLIKCVRYLLDNKQNPFILVHEGQKDYWIAQEISKALQNNIPIYKESDPLKVKGIIGACKGTLGSRFHGLVSSLSQNVPALGTGWSHKYKMLFEDYDFPEGIIDVSTDDKKIYDKLDMLIQSETNEKIKNIISLRAEEQKRLSKKMWEDVFRIIEAQ